MRPRWLRGWSFWTDARPWTPVEDRRPFWQRVAVFIGIRKEW